MWVPEVYKNESSLPLVFFCRVEDLVGKPAAIERFLMELLEDPTPPQVRYRITVFRYRIWALKFEYGTVKAGNVVTVG